MSEQIRVNVFGGTSVDDADSGIQMREEVDGGGWMFLDDLAVAGNKTSFRHKLTRDLNYISQLLNYDDVNIININIKLSAAT